MELVLVSYHPERVRELKRILQEKLSDVHFSSIVDFPTYQEEAMKSESSESRAAQKALSAVTALGKPCLADDSCLVIPALSGKFFREERRSSGVFLPNTKQVLQDLKDTDETERTAFLECSLAFATVEHGLIRTATCRIEGFIAPQEKGSSTFDFASIFIKYEYNKTLAELTPSVQSQISHRRKSCEKLMPFLRSYFLKNASFG